MWAWMEEVRVWSCWFWPLLSLRIEGWIERRRLGTGDWELGIWELRTGKALRRSKLAAVWGTIWWAGFQAGTGREVACSKSPETRFQRPMFATRSLAN